MSHRKLENSDLNSCIWTETVGLCWWTSLIWYASTAKLIIPFAKFLLNCYYIALLFRWRESAVVDTSGALPRRDHSTTVLHAHISSGAWTIGPLVAAVQRRSLTPSSSIISFNIHYPLRPSGNYMNHLLWQSVMLNFVLIGFAWFSL
jgi:hypothetical protein